MTDEERQKEDINIYKVQFPTQAKVSWTLQTVLYLDSKVLLVCRLLPCFSLVQVHVCTSIL